MDNPELPKNRTLIVLEYLLLFVCLSVLVLETTLTEGLSIQASTNPVNIRTMVFTVLVSTVLIFSFIIWIVFSLCTSNFRYRFSGIEIGLCLFVLAFLIAGLAASNKRAAITGFVIMAAPMFCAVLLVQLLDSQDKIKLLLVVIAALGIISTYQCQDQLFYWNQKNIQFYQQNPNAVLEEHNITANTLAHWQFEHRLYTKGVNGFFSTSNSAGSFAMLASFAAVALLLERFKNRSLYPSSSGSLIALGLAVIVIIFGFAITRSKGAIAAFTIAATMFIVFLCFGEWIKVHKKTILIVCLLLGLAGAGIVVSYGIAHDGLPGGNSMLVRWQYWTSTAKMYGDHFLTGVGPGNFSNFYPRYKLPQALESVSDPHNFPLSLLSQYGPLGVIGFIAAIAVPLCLLSFSAKESSTKVRRSGLTFKSLAALCLIIASVAMLLIRPMLLEIDSSASFEERKATVLILHIAPVVIFIIGFVLVAAPHAIREPKKPIPYTNIISAALFCGCAGCILHGLIDFAIFEPGVSNTFWIMLACLIALNFNVKQRPHFSRSRSPALKTLTVAVGFVLVCFYLIYVLFPVTASAKNIMRAAAEPESAHQFLDKAAQIDKLNPSILTLNGKLYVQRHKQTKGAQTKLLEKAARCFLGAIDRNPADYKNFELLAEVYNLLAVTSVLQHDDWLNKAFDNIKSAVNRYPGSASLRIEMANLAAQLGKTDLAVQQYKKAVEIEDSFQRQFQLMYPEYETLNRLGEEKYDLAKQKISELGK